MSRSGAWQTTAPKRSGRSTITAPTSRPPLLPLARDQVLGDGDEVVVALLLVRLDRGLVPLRPELAAAADVGEHEDTAFREPLRTAGAGVERIHRDLEAAIAVQQGRRVPAARRGRAQPLRPDDEVRHLHA